MKVTYDPNRDGLRILFSNAPIARSDNGWPGLILDFDTNDHLVGLELTEASQRMPNPRAVEFTEQRPPEPETASRLE
jgi:uncharacterized protein YuzE